jgi:hypothetical protein
MRVNKGRPGEDVCLIVHDFESYTPLTELVRDLQSSIKRAVPEARSPKIGSHVTIVPPFFASKQLQFGILFGMQLKWAGFSSFQFDAKVGYRISFFENENSDYAYLPITFPVDYVPLVNGLRSLVGDHGQWYHDPVKEKWVPHITVVEGIGIAKKVPPEFSDVQLDKVSLPVALPVKQPSLFKKIQSGWEEVTFQSLQSI